MKQTKKFKGILAIILSIVLIGGFIPDMGTTEVEAAEDTIEIIASKIESGDYSDYYDGDGLYIYGNDVVLNMDQNLSLDDIYIEGGNLTIKGAGNLEINDDLDVENGDYTQESGTNVSYYEDDFDVDGKIEIKQGATLNIDQKYSASDYCIYGCDEFISSGNVSINSSREGGIRCYGNVAINGGTLNINVNPDYDTYYGIYAKGSISFNGGTTRITTTSEYAVQAGKIVISGKQYIKTPEGGKVGEIGEETEDRIEAEGTVQNVAETSLTGSYSILDKDGNVAKNVVITDKAEEAAPEKATEDVTPTKEDNSSKKTYKNEWVNGQWYDADGKTSYKYKGSWKKDSIGWWYEDENGWFPTSRWQKIDGDWYYFDDIGYMAENQYAGNWDDYSEGFWWVGADGAWDGSEPGVWRLVGTKWWFKDSTGWYAKGKWYKIGGTWYEFDADGWWIEK